jgi:hypothetical protein
MDSQRRRKENRVDVRGRVVDLMLIFIYMQYEIPRQKI